MRLLPRLSLLAILLLLTPYLAFAKKNDTPSSEKVVTTSSKDMYKVHKHEKKKQKKQNRHDKVRDAVK